VVEGQLERWKLKGIPLAKPTTHIKIIPTHSERLTWRYLQAKPSDEGGEKSDSGVISAGDYKDV